VRFESRSEVQSITLRQLVNRKKVPNGPQLAPVSLCSLSLVFSIMALPTAVAPAHHQTLGYRWQR